MDAIPYSEFVALRWLGKTPKGTPSRMPYGSGYPGSGRMVFTSTDYRWIRPSAIAPAKFVKVFKGRTYKIKELF